MALEHESVLGMGEDLVGLVAPLRESLTKKNAAKCVELFKAIWDLMADCVPGAEQVTSMKVLLASAPNAILPGRSFMESGFAFHTSHPNAPRK